MIEGDIEGCHQACIDLINTPNLPIDLKIETIHIMSTLVPLDQAHTFLEDALRLAGNKTREEPKNYLWIGLLATTNDQMWKISKIQGAIKFHREITFGNPIAGELLLLQICIFYLHLPKLASIRSRARALSLQLSRLASDSPRYLGNISANHTLEQLRAIGT